MLFKLPADTAYTLLYHSTDECLNSDQLKGVYEFSTTQTVVWQQGNRHLLMYS